MRHMDSGGLTSGVAATIRTLMVERGVTQVAMAEATGIPRVTLIRRLNGHSSFTIAELAAIADHLGVAASSLLVDAA